MTKSEPNPKQPTPATSTSPTPKWAKQQAGTRPGPSPFSKDNRVALGSPIRSPGGFATRRPVIVFVLCLAAGLVAAGWRAKVRADEARAHARNEAAARAMAVESQLEEGVTAAETLGMLARQSGGAIPNFQKVTAELLSKRPCLASLELQPGGVVSEIFPRAGYEQVIGLNVLRNPAYGPGAQAAIRARTLAADGPIALYRGEAGVIVRMPVFLRGRDGREDFWGLVAASVRLTDALTRAQLADLVRDGYAFRFLTRPPGGQKPVTIAARGALSLEDAVQQPVRVRNLEFRLAVAPRRGWLNKTALLLECLGVTVAAGLAGLLVNLAESRRHVERTLTEAQQRLASENKEREQAQEECRSAQTDAAATKAELERTRSALQSSTEQEVRLAASARKTEEAAQASQTELEQARTALQQGEQTIRSLQARLRDRAEAEQATVSALQSRLQTAEATISGLRNRLEELTHEPGEATVPETAAPLQEPNASPEPLLPNTEAEAPEATQPAEAAAAPMPDATEPETSTSAPPEVPAEQPTPSPVQVSEKPNLPSRSRRKKRRPDNQMDLFESEPPRVMVHETLDAETAAKPEDSSRAEDSAEAAPEKPEPEPTKKEASRRRSQRPPPPVDLSALRKAVNQIVPLFTGEDPGARDCLKDNRDTFCSAFAPDVYLEFEQAVKKSDFPAALEHLKKAARRHGIPV